MYFWTSVHFPWCHTVRFDPKYMYFTVCVELTSEQSEYDYGYDWGVLGLQRVSGRNAVTVAYELGMESFKGCVVTNDTRVLMVRSCCCRGFQKT